MPTVRDFDLAARCDLADKLGFPVELRVQEVEALLDRLERAERVVRLVSIFRPPAVTDNPLTYDFRMRDALAKWEAAFYVMNPKATT